MNSALAKKWKSLQEQVRSLNKQVKCKSESRDGKVQYMDVSKFSTIIIQVGTNNCTTDELVRTRLKDYHNINTWSEQVSL